MILGFSCFNTDEYLSNQRNGTMMKVKKVLCELVLNIVQSFVIARKVHFMQKNIRTNSKKLQILAASLMTKLDNTTAPFKTGKYVFDAKIVSFLSHRSTFNLFNHENLPHLVLKIRTTAGVSSRPLLNASFVCTIQPTLFSFVHVQHWCQDKERKKLILPTESNAAVKDELRVLALSSYSKDKL